MRFLLPASALLLLCACLARPFEPPGAQPFVPDAIYTLWWQQMEACSGVTGSLDRIEWYAVPGDEFATPDGSRWGWWDPPHTIYVAATHLLDQDLVEHEMLHDLLQTGEHPTVFDACNVREPALLAQRY